MSDIYLHYKQRINDLIKNDSRYIDLPNKNKMETEQNIMKLLDNYLQKKNFLKKIENMDFIIELLKDPIKEQIAIIDYTNLEKLIPDSVESFLFVFNWIKYFQIKNIIIVSKKNSNINKYIKKLLDLDANIILINTDGIKNNLMIEINKDFLNSMMNDDDSLCLLIIQKLFNSKIPRENIFLLTADMKMLEENYAYIPPFIISYQNIYNGKIELNNNNLLMDTINAPFYNQKNYNEYLRHLDEHYILEPITVDLIETLNQTDTEEYYKRKYYKYKIKYQELLKEDFSK